MVLLVWNLNLTQLVLVKPFPPEILHSPFSFISTTTQAHSRWSPQTPHGSGFCCFFKFYWWVNLITTILYTCSLSTDLNRTIFLWRSQLRILKKYAKPWLSVKHLRILNCHTKIWTLKLLGLGLLCHKLLFYICFKDINPEMDRAD